MFQKNNLATAGNIFEKGKKYVQLISPKLILIMKQTILLMIPNTESKGWFYLAVKKLSTLLRGTTWNHYDYFYCLSCLHSFQTENKLDFYEKVCKNEDFCGIVMPSEKDNILEFNQYMKSDKISYIIYADIEFLFKEIDTCANNPKHFWATKIGEHRSQQF